MLRLLLPALIAVAFTSGSADGETSVALPAPGSSAWAPQNFPRIERHTAYRTVEEAGRPVLVAHSECSAEALVLPLPELDLHRTPRLRWRWKVERGLDNSRERTRSGDDFAARVYVIFPFDEASSSRWERLRRALAERLYGRAFPGHSLNYVWASHILPGTTWTSPYSEHSRVRALRGGETGAWHTETVDLLADHRRWRGEPERPPQALALMSDTDDTCGSATAYFADFRLLEPGESPRGR